MTDNRQKYIDKVRKLLSMAQHNASNENEAATALRQAESLMRRYDIAHSELEASKLKADDMMRGDTNESRNSLWVWYLAWAAANVTDTKPTKRKGLVQFVGVTEDVQIALMFFDYLTNVVERLAKNYAGTRSERNAFKMGAVMGIGGSARKIQQERREAFAQANTTGTDLVEAKGALIESTFNLRYGKAKPVTVSSVASYRAGLAAGKKVSLTSQIGGTSRSAIR